MSTLAEFLTDRLSSVGIKHLYTVAGDYTLSLLNRIAESKKIEIINTTSEQSAGFAADGYARVHGIGCCCVTYCVGGFNIINAIGCAEAEKSPVVLISGSPGIKERNEDLLLHHMVRSFECQHKVFSKITCANTVLRNPVTAAYEIDRVLQMALQYKRPVYIEVPRDMVDRPIIYDPYREGTPKDKMSDQAVMSEVCGLITEYVNKSKHPVVLAGVEIARFGLGEQVIRFCENYNLPIATTLLGKSVVNEMHPLSLGVYAGGMSNPKAREIVESSDCLIMLGVMQTDVNFGFYPLKVKKDNIVLCTSEEMRIKNAYFKNVLFADLVNSLIHLPITPCKNNKLRDDNHIQELSFVPETNKKITVSRFFQKINTVLDDKTAIISDVGDSLFGSSDLVIRNSNLYLAPAFYTTMGFAVSACLGVMTAKPELRPFVFVGDGSFQMTSSELSTLVRRKLNPVIFVLNNRGYLTERCLLDGTWNNLQNWNYHKISELIGGNCRGYVVELEEELETCLQEIESRHKELAVVNVILDKNDSSAALKRMTEKIYKKI